VLANGVFNRPVDALTGVEVLLGTYAFAFQIYGDFSGYSSIAQGLSRLLGFNLMWNFRMPYFAVSPSDFWQRWHISLSSWLRDYLYIPLGGNRGGSWRTARNLTFTMLLGGLWHGANWTFLVWGAVHALALVLYRAVPWLEPTRHGSAHVGKLQYLVRAVVLFHIVCVAWIFFRAETLTQAVGLLTTITQGGGAQLPFVGYAAGLLAFFVLPLLAYEGWLETQQDQLALLRQPALWQAGAFAYLMLMTILFVPDAPQLFIYFQF
jgi:alginate O-acetyltransferase complex protein AlgI